VSGLETLVVPRRPGTCPHRSGLYYEDDKKEEEGDLMELKITAADLTRALARSLGIVERKSTMPILSHVLLEARKGNALHVSATDLDLSVSSEHTTNVEVVKEGSVAVPAKTLTEIVRSLPQTEKVSLKKAGNNYLELRCGPSEFRIVGLPAEDFPALPKFEKVAFVDVVPTPPRTTRPATTSTASSSSRRGRCFAWWPPTATAWRSPRSRWPATTR
jgi:hypothetical protein